MEKGPDDLAYGVILFTDLVGSTEKASLFGDSEYFDKVLAAHNVVLSESIKNNDGRIIKSIGDAYFAIFGWEHMAIKCCVEAQSRFAEINVDRPKEMQINVRMALHSGEYRLKLMDNNHVDAFGSSINYAARMISVAGGRQIFVSPEFLNRWNHCMELDRNIEQEIQQKELDEERAESFRKSAEDRLNSMQDFSFSSAGHFSFKGIEGDQHLSKLNMKNID